MWKFRRFSKINLMKISIQSAKKGWQSWQQVGVKKFDDSYFCLFRMLCVCLHQRWETFLSESISNDLITVKIILQIKSISYGRPLRIVCMSGSQFIVLSFLSQKLKQGPNLEFEKYFSRAFKAFFKEKFLRKNYLKHVCTKEKVGKNIFNREVDRVEWKIE